MMAATESYFPIRHTRSRLPPRSSSVDSDQSLAVARDQRLHGLDLLTRRRRRLGSGRRHPKSISVHYAETVGELSH